MIGINLWQLILLLGVPSTLTTAIIGFAIWRLQMRMIKNDEKQVTKEENQDEYQLLILNTLNASVKLGIATATAIRDGKSNGITETALENAQTVTSEQQKFVEKQGIQNLRF